MIEVILRDYLLEELETVPVYLEYPQEVPEEFVLLKKIDAGHRDHIDAATFRIESRAHSLYHAAVLSEKVKDALFNAISLPSISSSMLGGERQGTDTSNNLYQYDLTYNFYYYQEE